MDHAGDIPFNCSIISKKYFSFQRKKSFESKGAKSSLAKGKANK
jgi:hypothetical protein